VTNEPITAELCVLQNVCDYLRYW